MNLEKSLNTIMGNVKNTMSKTKSKIPFMSSKSPSTPASMPESMQGSIPASMPESMPRSNITFSPMNSSSYPSVNEISPQVKPKTRFTPWFFFKIGLAIIIFGLLGFNIFTYLKTGTDAISHYFGKFFKKGKDTIGSTTDKASSLTGNLKDTLSDNLSADDITSAIDKSAEKLANEEKHASSSLKNIVEKGLNKKKQKTKDKKDDSFFDSEEDKEKKNNEENDIKQKENKLANRKDEESDDEEEEEETDPKKKYNVGKNYEASSVLDLKMSKTPGYCYVGTDRNVRTCVKIKAGDKCMSGKVFPTMDLCINPNIKE